MSDTAKIIALAKAVAPKIDPAAIESAVSDWLDDHPEATTTVEDGAITYAKLDSSLKGSVDDVSDLKNAINECENAIEMLDAGSLSALGANSGQVPIANGDGTWTWENQNYVTPEMFGAKGDGITDDSDAIQNAINFCITNGKELRFMRKTYGVMPKQTQNIALKYNTAKYALIIHGELHIDMNGATIQLLENDEAKVVTLIVIDAKGGSIRNGTFIGDRLTYTNTGAQWDSSKCLELYEASDYTIENVIMKDSKGDCLGIGGVQNGQQNVNIEYVDYEMNILVKNCTMINGKRGCFTADKYRGVTFENCLFDETSDIGFAFAIDFEPYYGLGNGFDCTFINCTTKGENAGVNVQLVTGTKFISCNIEGFMARQADGIELIGCNVGSMLLKTAEVFASGCVFGSDGTGSAISFQPTSTLTIAAPSVEVYDSKILGSIGGSGETDNKHDHLYIIGCSIYMKDTSGSVAPVNFSHSSKLYKNGVVVKNNTIKVEKSSQHAVSGAVLLKSNYEDITIQDNLMIFDVQTIYGGASILGVFNYSGKTKVIGNTIENEKKQNGNYVIQSTSIMEINYPVNTPIVFIENKYNTSNAEILTNSSYKTYAFKDNGDKDGSVYVLATDNYLEGIEALTASDTSAVSFTANIGNIINNTEPNPSSSGVSF